MRSTGADNVADSQRFLQSPSQLLLPPPPPTTPSTSPPFLPATESLLNDLANWRSNQTMTTEVFYVLADPDTCARRLTLLLAQKTDLRSTRCVHVGFG